MLADNFCDVVTERVCRVRIVCSIGNVTCVLAKTAAVGVRHKVDARQDIVTVSGEYVRNNKPWEGGALPITHVVQNDVVSGIAEYEFIQQCRRKTGA